MAGCAQEYEVEVQADPEDAGEIKGEGTYEEGEEVTVEAKPEEGYEFLGWEINGDKVSEDKNYDFEISDDKQFEAIFEKEHAIETESVHLEKVSTLPPGIAGPTTPFIEASLEENFLLYFRTAQTGWYMLADLQEYKETDRQEYEIDGHPAADALAEETAGHVLLSHNPSPEVSNGKVANSYGFHAGESGETTYPRGSFIDIGALKVPFEAEHQIELKGQEFAIGTKPAWDSDQEGIYYITPDGIMRYSLAQEISDKIIPSTDLKGLITTREDAGEERKIKEVALHDFNLQGDSEQLAYLYEDKLKVVPLEDKLQKEIIEVDFLQEDVEELELLFDGEYVVVDGHFIETNSGEIKEFESEGEYFSHAWNGEDELLVMFEKENEEIGHQIKLQTYDEKLNKQNEAYIDVISGSDDLSANVTDLDDEWGILLPGEKRGYYDLYKAYFD